MSDLKDPFDSLKNYFDDLLLMEDLADDSELENALPKSIESAHTSEPLSLPKTTVDVKAATQLIADIPFADPVLDQKEKLQKLLLNVQPKIEAAPIVKVEPAAVFVANPTEIQEWDIEVSAPVSIEVTAPVAAPPVQSLVVSPSDIAPQHIESVEEKHYQVPSLEWMPNGLPQWAQARFDVLLFKVSGLILAVPLISLGQIQPITDELTPLFGQADWFMGLQPTPQGKIRTVNTAKFVMPERYDESFVKNAKYVVSINGVPWGLAVDSVNQPITLMPDDVKWRTDRSKRPWLAGTVKEHMCALLDIPMIGQLLLDADKNFKESNHKR